MSKSKCDAELEQMTAERDHWRTIAKQRAEDVRRLQNQVDRQSTLSGAVFRGAAAELDQAYAKLQEERDQWRDKAVDLHNVINFTLPGWVIEHQDIESGTVEVGISLILRYGNGASEWKASRLSKVFHGTYEQALNEILPAVVLAAARVPEPSDLMPKGELPGLTKADIYDTLHDLAAPYWLDNEREYKRLRNEAFDKHWPRMEQTERSKGLIPDRNKLHVQFDRAIDGAFERLRGRRGKTIEMLETPQLPNQTLNV